MVKSDKQLYFLFGSLERDLKRNGMEGNAIVLAEIRLYVAKRLKEKPRK